MLTIAKLFGKSPFAPLQTHIDKVACCIGELPLLFQSLLEQDTNAIDRIAEKISLLEHEADLTKNDIRTHLPRSLFLPVDHGALLEILSFQDSLADQAEKIAQLAAMRKLELLQGMQEEFSSLCSKTLEAFWIAHKVIKELEELLESSFGGIEAQKVKAMVEQIAFCEYETAQMQLALTKKLYQGADALAYPAFHLCLSLIKEISHLAVLSEELGNRIRMLLELK